MAEGQEFVEVKAIDGTNVKITLADWAKVVIDRALQKHKLECPVEKYREERIKAFMDTDKDIIALDKRIMALEVSLKIIRWLLVPFYIALAGWLINLSARVFESSLL